MKIISDKIYETCLDTFGSLKLFERMGLTVLLHHEDHN